MATTYYPLSDLLYRSTALTDDSGNIKEAYDTDAYGNTQMYSGPGTDGQWFTNDDQTTDQPACEYIFTGRQYDPESQIYFYRARYYHPQLGRFIARDSILLHDIPNLYQYTRSCPINALDPRGLKDFQLGGGAYEGFGGSVDLDIQTTTSNCCTSDTGPSTKTKYQIDLDLSVGIGIGGHVDAWGYDLELQWKGPQLFGKASGECESDCGGSWKDCCKICASIGIQVGESVSLGLGIKVELAIDVNGTIKACYLIGNKCPGTGFAWGFCGHVSIELIAHLFKYSKHLNLVPPTDGCHAFSGTNAMLV